jgi:hypothetical protein
MKNFQYVLCTMLVCAMCVLGTACSKTEKAGNSTADTISKTLVEQPMDKAKRTRLLADLTTITRAIQVFNAEKGRYPKDIQELVDSGYIATYPREPFGGKYVYDATKGTVKSSTHPNIKPGMDM